MNIFSILKIATCTFQKPLYFQCICRVKLTSSTDYAMCIQSVKLAYISLLTVETSNIFIASQTQNQHEWIGASSQLVTSCVQIHIIKVLEKTSALSVNP